MQGHRVQVLRRLACDGMRRRIRELLGQLRDWWNGPPHRHASWEDRERSPVSLTVPPRPGYYDFARITQAALRATEPWLLPVIRADLDGFPTVTDYLDHLFSPKGNQLPCMSF
jgi:hypothetical protein